MFHSALLSCQNSHLRRCSRNRGKKPGSTEEFKWPNSENICGRCCLKFCLGSSLCVAFSKTCRKYGKVGHIQTCCQTQPRNYLYMSRDVHYIVEKSLLMWSHLMIQQKKIHTAYQNIHQCLQVKNVATQLNVFRHRFFLNFISTGQKSKSIDVYCTICQNALQVWIITSTQTLYWYRYWRWYLSDRLWQYRNGTVSVPSIPYPVNISTETVPCL